MSRGIDLGDSAMHLLDRSTFINYGENGPNITQATERINHLTGTKAELLEAIAYLALQVGTYRHRSNEDAPLALHNIETILRQYKERR